MPARLSLGMVQPRGNSFIKNFIDQRTFAGAGHSGHQRHGSKRELHADILEIIFLRADDLNVMPIARSALRWNRNEPAAGQVLSGHGFRNLHDLLRRTLCDHSSAMRSRAGTDVDNMICRIHRILIMLNDNERIAQIAQFFQRGQQTVIIALMQADARFVQYIKHTLQTGTDLGSQTNTLSFSSGKRTGRTRQSQIIQTDIQQEIQARMISLRICAAIFCSRAVSSTAAKNSSASRMVSSVTSWIFFPPTVTANVSGFRRAP